MEKIITVELDWAKSIFQVYGIAENGQVLVHRSPGILARCRCEGR